MTQKQHIYLMEGSNEASRLAAKDRNSATSQQLLETGFLAACREGAQIVDAGTGVGVVAEQMARLANEASARPQLLLLDASQDRLDVAKAKLSAYACPLTTLCCQLDQIPLPDNSVDYLFCRFVFEYLPDQQAVFREYLRILKPGGKMVIGDLDYNAMSHYPLSPVLEQQLNSIVQAIQASGTFDFYAGRKLYSYYYHAGLADIKVHFYAHHLLYGEIQESDDMNWTIKLDRLRQLQEQGVLKFDFSIAEFAEGFLKFFRSPERFSYTPLILVEGIKPTA